MTDRIDWTGRLLRLRVGGPAHGGEFVARHEGRVVFCRGGISGELVDVLVDDDPGRAFCRGTVVDVIEPGPERVAPSCPAAAAGAGCCDWSHIDKRAARDFTGRVLAEQVRRIGRIDTVGETIPVDAPGGDEAATGWRTVARWVTGPDGAPGVRRARSHELVTEPCAQPDPRILEAVAAAGIGPGREVLGVLGDGGDVHVASRRLVDAAPRGSGRRSRRSAATRSRARQTRAGAWELAIGADTVVRRVGGRTWDLPLDGFWQAHRSAAGHYADLVREAVGQVSGAREDPEVWDLYGGAGLFASAVLDIRPKAHVSVVESSAAALDAVASGVGADAVCTVRSRVESFLEDPDRGDRGSTPDVVVLDPPRGGAGIEVMSRLSSSVGSRIVHVGCDPASLARDIGVLVAAGWRLTELRGVAAFPGTHHVEGLAILDAPPTA